MLSFRILSRFILSIYLLSAFSCSEDEKRSQKIIISFKFTKIENESLASDIEGIVDETAKAITVVVPFNQSKTELVPSIDVSPGSNITPANSEPQDFSNPVIYTITAEDGSFVSYTVTVNSKPTPIIDSIDPSAGSFKMEVTITGSNFSEDSNGNKIMFNGREAEVLSVAENKLIVKVPSDASTGPVSLTIDGGTVNGPTFSYYDIYIIGDEHDEPNNRVIPKIWKNGVSTALTEVPNNSNSMTSKIMIVNSDIYIAGNIWGGDRFTPGYWKNSIFNPVTDGSAVATCSDIFVDGNDIYVSGIIHDGTKWSATYWKNDVRVLLPTDELDYSEATSITVANGSVYVGAFVGDYPDTFFPLYWKDGQENLLTGNASVNDIQVTETDVHVVGSNWWSGNSVPVTYWKNSSPQYLTTGARPGGAVGMTFDGSDVYIAGFEEEVANNFLPKAKLWKNGSETSLIQGLQDSIAAGVMILDGNVIVAGQIKNGQNYAIFYKFNDQIVMVTNGESSIDVKGMVAK